MQTSVHMINSMASSSLWKILYLPNFIHTSEGTMGYVMSDTWCKVVWDPIINAGPHNYPIFQDVDTSCEPTDIRFMIHSLTGTLGSSSCPTIGMGSCSTLLNLNSNSPTTTPVAHCMWVTHPMMGMGHRCSHPLST